jgi:glycosyltransferase involved in cell wall biosynthesis
MKVAQVAPLYESVPPRFYGGTERVVSYLTEELVRQGHEVTLFASADSVTSARLLPTCSRPLPMNMRNQDHLARHILLVEQVFRESESFDLVHFHTDYVHFPLARWRGLSHVTTLHGRLDTPDILSVFQEFPEMPVVSISDAQRRPLPRVNWQGTVYHGLPDALYTFRGEPGKYLAFLGRISPEKGVDRAIKIANRVKMELRIAAKVDAKDQAYFQDVIKPLLKGPYINFVGQINEDEKDEFLGRAYALLFPIDWPEPFGLVMIEAMACGTPVIAYRNGSVPEVLADGRTGFVVDNLNDAVRAVGRAAALKRRDCRRLFEERFAAARMARDYVRVYERLLEKNTKALSIA